MKKICLYCNWKVKKVFNGFYIPNVHALYLKEFKKHAVGKVLLLSNISEEEVSCSDVFVKDDDVELLSLPGFKSYFSALRYLHVILYSIYTAVNKSNFVYIRTPEPFGWFFSIIKLISCKRDVVLNFHMTSSPLNTIWNNHHLSLCKRLVMVVVFYPEYIATCLAAFFNQVSCNGPSVVDRVPFFLRKKIRVLIESTKLDSDFHHCQQRNALSNVETINFIVVSRLVPAKGFDVILNAFYYIEKSINKKYKLHFVGDGPLRNEMEQLAQTLGISKNIVFHGYVRNGVQLDKIYQSCHVFVNPSLSETGPRVLLEAMAQSLYCISTDVGYARQVMTDDGGQLCGSLIPAGSVQAMALEIQMVMSSINECMKKALGGYELSRKFTLNNFVVDVLAVDNY